MDEGGYTQEELTDAIDTLDQSGKIIFGGNFTASSWPDIRARVRYLAVSKGVKIVYLDNLTALIDTNNERASVETIVKEISLLAQELGIIIIVVSHQIGRASCRERVCQYGVDLGGRRIITQHTKKHYIIDAQQTRNKH